MRPGSLERTIAAVASRLEVPKYSHHIARVPRNATSAARTPPGLQGAGAGECRTRGEQQLPERDDDELLAALGEMSAVDRPLARA